MIQGIIDKIPFSIYDFFGYLGAGTLALFAGFFAVQGFDAFDIDLNLSQMTLLIIAAYITGHVVAAISSFLLERQLTRGFIGSPTKLLFGETDPEGWRKIFGAYHVPLPAKIRQLVLDKAEKKADIVKSGESLFYHCFGVVRQDEYPRERLATFLNLYGFSRNVAMASLLAGVILVVAALFNEEVPSVELWIGSAASFLVSVVMYFRYLKFYRQYSVELYVTYAGMV